MTSIYSRVSNRETFRLAALVVAWLLIFVSPPGRAEVQILKGHIPRAVASLQPLRRLETARRLDLAIGLPLRNRESLTNLLEQLYNPASPNYRHYLNPRQFAERFSPTEEDYQAVVTFAKSNHLVVTGEHPNRTLLDVNGGAADIERAFHLRLRLYQHPAEPRAFYSPDVEPSLDARLPVLSIAGLDDFFLPRPVDLRTRVRRPDTSRAGGGGIIPAGTWQRSRTNSRPTSLGGSAFPGEVEPTLALDATGSGPAGTFIGSDFRAAYAPGVLLDGQGESVGLLELDGYYPSDISEYEDLAGIRQVPLTNVLVNGFNRLPGSNNGEVALDIEMAVSMAPGLARVIVYEGTTGNSILNRMATDNQARQLSSSWTFGHPVDATREQIFQQFAAQGQSIFQASGDAGAYASGVSPPADDPFVTAVGGTSLITSQPGGAWVSEAAWSGSGGGVSSNYTIPVWQRPISIAANQGSATMRNVPDVATLADATIWVFDNNGEQATAAGTSAAAPLWAGFAALVNQQAAANHQPGIGFINPAIYAIGQGPAYSAAFHDVTVGNNTNAASPNQFYAVAGYDLCTGWGTPTGSNLVNALLEPPDALQIRPGSSALASGPIGGPFIPALESYALSNAGAASISWALGSTSTWLDVSPRSGSLSATGPGTTVKLTLNSVAATLVPASYTADLRFTNLNNGFAQTRQVTLSIVTPPLITGQPASQSLPIGATARFVVQTSTNALMFFQWQLNGANLQDHGNMAGSATPVLTLANIGVEQAGTYSVVVSNAAGFAISSAAVLTVTSSPPLIAVQPIAQTVLPGSSAAFSVSAFGDEPLAYQWRGNGTNLVAGGNVSGAISNVLTLTSVSSTDARTYSVVVSNALGGQTSIEAELTVPSLTTPEIVQASVYAFPGGAGGGHPNGLTLGTDGKLYGTTLAGGTNASGAIFQIEAGGQPYLLQSFSGASDGDRPNGGLVQAADGALLGTTYTGGSNAFGTIFRFNTNTGLTTLFSFDHTNGVLPTAGLAAGTDGSLYGAAYEGGIFHYGALFRFDTNSAFAVLAPFASTNGAFPHGGLVRGSDDSFYGATYKGGAYDNGTVFRMSPSGALTILAAFNGTNGAFPMGALTEADDGSFYGTTTSGGALGLGSVFRITPDSPLTTQFAFSGVADGSHPRAALIQGSDGNFYGTTTDGGSFGAGTVFRMTPGGALTTIAQFDGFNGANPEAPLLEDTDGSLLGVTQNGGPADQGVIFRLSIPSTPPQITSQPGGLVTYDGATVTLRVAGFGSSPLFYQWQKNGINLANGSQVLGAQSRSLVLTNVSPANAGAYSVIVSNFLGSIPSAPAVLQVLVSAPLIMLQPTNQTVTPGSTVILRAGVIGNLPLDYQWQASGTNLLDAGNLSGSTTDTLTLTNVTEANNGTYTLVATNSLGRTNSAGAILSVVPVSAVGTKLSTLYSFTGGTDGSSPNGLADGRDGYLYGTTQLGGSFHNGNAFKIGTNGGFIMLVSFDQTNGAFPLAGLVLSTNRNFYGTTSAGGASGAGTVLAMTPAGEASILHEFTGGNDGGSPATALIQGTDGGFYGATQNGGANGLGTIFRITSGGTLGTLHAFVGGAEASSPAGALLELSHGTFYGTSASGGTSNQGSVFRLIPGGALTTLYSFTGGMDGYHPVGSLVLGDDGALYGATSYNTIRGFAFYGTLFNLSTNGALQTLYALNFTDGSYPAAGLVLSRDGNFYDTTEQGGAADYGTVFRMTPGGVVSTLVEFDGFNDGANPVTALTEGSDGNLYGTTSAGGPGGHGTIFRLSFSGAPQITAQPVGQTGLTGGSAVFSVAVTGGAPLSYQWQRSATNLTDHASLRGASTRILRLANLTLADAGSYSVIVTNASGSLASSGAVLSVEVSPPSFQIVSQSGGNLNLSWSTAPGHTYQLQSKTSLATANWISLNGSITAAGESLETSTPMSSNSQRFYRVILLP